MEDGVMLLMRRRCIAKRLVMRTMPMALELRRALLEDLSTAFRAKHIIPQAKILMQHERPLRNPLITVLASYVAFIRWHFAFVGRLAVDGFLLGIGMPSSKCISSR